MSITFAMTLASSMFTPVGDFFKHFWVGVLAFFLLIVPVCWLIGDEKIRKKVPENYALLFAATIGESCFVAAIAANLTPGSVLTAMAALAIVTGLLYIAATYTAVNETLLRNLITAVVIGTFVNLILCILVLVYGTPKNSGLFIMLSVGVCIIFGAYIVFDLVIILIPGAADKEDYILHALSLYLDLVRLFIQLLILLGEEK